MALSNRGGKQCSFCGRDEQDVQLLVSGASGNICETCIEQAHRIVEGSSERSSSSRLPRTKLLFPNEIKSFLDQYVIGQEEAKRVLSVAVYNHYKRLNYAMQKKSSESEDVEIDKSNLLLIGETGTGKTLLARSIARLLQVPFTIVDATVFTQAGYVGEDVESILSRLLQVADYDVPRAEQGIVFIDEIDKIARKGDNPSITRDVSGEGVQQSLLKLLEGTEVLVPPQGGRKHPDQQMVKVNTANILFICGGAFDGLDRVILKRIASGNIGFKHERTATTEEKKRNPFKYVSPQDLKNFGLIPELIGRIPVVSFLHPLDKTTIKKILTEPKNALIKQYKKLFQMDGIELVLEEDAIDLIVEKALELKLGARGLRSICEKIFNQLFFEIKIHQATKRIALGRKKTEKLFLEQSA